MPVERIQFCVFTQRIGMVFVLCFMILWGKRNRFPFMGLLERIIFPLFSGAHRHPSGDTFRAAPDIMRSSGSRADCLLVVSWLNNTIFLCHNNNSSRSNNCSSLIRLTTTDNIIGDNHPSIDDCTPSEKLRINEVVRRRDNWFDPWLGSCGWGQSIDLTDEFKENSSTRFNWFN